MKRLFTIMIAALILAMPPVARADMLDFIPALLAGSVSRDLSGQWTLTVTFTEDGSSSTLDIGILRDSGQWVQCDAYGQKPLSVSGDTLTLSVEGVTLTGTIASDSSVAGSFAMGTWSMTKDSDTAFCPNVVNWTLTQHIPKFVTSDFTELAKTSWISKFRSGMGHDYSDDYESCRSMKHYYTPSVADWSTVAITSPVDGQIVSIRQEWAGSQVHIRSSDYPSFTFIIFHMTLNNALGLGDSVTAGQVIGNHVSNETSQDIALRLSVDDNGKTHKLISFFDVMTDGLFATYSGFTNDRNDFIISEAERDADPLSCNGETFANGGNLPNVVYPR